MNWKRCAILTIVVTLALLAASGDGMAQSSSGVSQVPAPRVQGTIQSQGVTLGLVGAGGLAGGEGAKGAPYSADTITESTQVLSDGNRITHKTVGKVYRDSEGRTRHEQTVEPLMKSTSTAPGDAIQWITINDPVAGAHYVLDPRSKTAQRISFAAPSSPEGVTFSKTTESLRVSNRDLKPMEHQNTTQSLGTQIMEGLETQGTGTTTVFPAGAFGNERPIETVSEIWFSPALHTAVLTKRIDPRIGEMVTRLTNISLEEPDPLLFQIPADYTGREQPAGSVSINRFAKPVEEGPQKKPDN